MGLSLGASRLLQTPTERHPTRTPTELFLARLVPWTWSVDSLWIGPSRSNWCNGLRLSGLAAASHSCVLLRDLLAQASLLVSIAQVDLDGCKKGSENVSEIASPSLLHQQWARVLQTALQLQHQRISQRRRSRETRQGARPNPKQQCQESIGGRSRTRMFSDRERGVEGGR